MLTSLRDPAINLYTSVVDFLYIYVSLWNISIETDSFDSQKVNVYMTVDIISLNVILLGSSAGAPETETRMSRIKLKK